MNRWEKIPLVDYTKAEEIMHTLTHGAGLILSALIVVTCLRPAVLAHDRLRIACAALYLFGTTVMFLTSALYHAVPHSNAKRVLRLLDHCMIFFAVAGTATACVPAVYDTVGTVPAVLMTVCAWAGAVGGLLLTMLAFETTKGLQMAIYIVTAFVCAFCGMKAFFVLPHGALFCLLGGGACLLLGAALYGVGKRKRWFHTVFHVMIDIGLTIFWIGIKTYCY